MRVEGQALRRILTAYDRFIDGLAFAAALMLGAMALWITYEVIARYFFLRPSIWSNDLAEYALLWATFLAAPWVLRKEGHVTVDVLVNRLNASLRRWFGIISSLVGALICAVYAWHTALSVLDFYIQGWVIARAWQVPQYIPHAIIPVGAALLAIEFVRRAVRFASREPPPTETSTLGTPAQL